MSEWEAGPALDVEIGRRIFAIKRVYYPHDPSWPYYIPSGKPWRTHSIDGRLLPRFSQDIAAAWAIVDVWDGDVEVRRQNGAWQVTFYRPSEEYEVWADTAPLGICLAALAAVEVRP